MGILGSKFQSPSQGLEDIAEGSSTNRKHGCECKKRKRNVPCDCESEQEEDDGLLDTPRRYANSGEQAVPFMVCFNCTPLTVVFFQEEIEKHIKIYLSDLVLKWGK